MAMHHQLAGRSRYGSLHTFVFVDVVGFTALADLGSDYRAFGRRRHAHAVLEEHGAQQIKAVGGGLVLRFARSARGVRGARLLARAPVVSDSPAGVAGAAQRERGDGVKVTDPVQVLRAEASTNNQRRKPCSGSPSGC